MARNIVITGASSGIGRALALHYAKKGVTLGLLGRHQQRLDDVAMACREGGAVVSTALIDVRSSTQLEAWLVAFDTATPIDLLFANAGIMGGAPPGADLEIPEIGRALIETNVIGVLNTVYAVMPRMVERRAGQIAIVSSLAGLTPVPDAPSYGASKAAVLSFGLALRSLVYKSGVKVNVVCPGYVLTPMTAQEHGQKPFLISAERAAELIANGLDRDKSIIALTPGLVVMRTASATVSGDSVLLTIYGEVGEPPKVATIHIPMPIRETEELVASLQTAISEASKNSHGA